MINLIKKAIFDKLDTLFKGEVFYDYAPLRSGIHYVFEIITVDDSDTHCTDNLSLHFQVLVVYPETTRPKHTTLEPDSDLELIKNAFKLVDIRQVDGQKSVETKSILCDTVSPAKYDFQTKQTVGFIRFRADFTITKGD